MKLNRVTCLLLGTSLIINAALALVGPFFPQEAEEKGVDINIIGYIFSAYPLSFVIVSLIMPKILNWYSQRFMFIVGSITYALSVIGFGLLIFVDNEFFLVMAITCRVLQGASNSVVYTTAYSVFSMQYEGHDIMQINSYFKVTLGAGLVIGLMIGTLLYMVGGYCLPFIVFGVFFLCFVPRVIGYFPSKIEISSDLQEHLFENNNSEHKRDDKFIEFNSNQRIVDLKDQRFYSIKPSIQRDLPSGKTRHKYSFDHAKRETLDVENSNSSQRGSKLEKFEVHQDSEAGSQGVTQSVVTKIIVKCLILAILFLSLLNFAPAILSKRLEELKIHEYLYGLIFAIPWIIPVWSIFLVNIMMNKFNGNAVLITGTILMAFGFFIVAIESVFFFLIGISILGFAAPFAILPLFPLMRNSLSSDFRNSSEMINTLAGLYNAALGVGAIAGPLIGSHLYFYFGFFTTAYVLGNFWILLSIILFCFGGWWRSDDDGNEWSDLTEHPGVLNSSFMEPNILPVPSGRNLSYLKKTMI